MFPILLVIHFLVLLKTVFLKRWKIALMLSKEHQSLKSVDKHYPIYWRSLLTQKMKQWRSVLAYYICSILSSYSHTPRSPVFRLESGVWSEWYHWFSFSSLQKADEWISQPLSTFSNFAWYDSHKAPSPGLCIYLQDFQFLCRTLANTSMR